MLLNIGNNDIIEKVMRRIYYILECFVEWDYNVQVCFR